MFLASKDLNMCLAVVQVTHTALGLLSYSSACIFFQFLRKELENKEKRKKRGVDLDDRNNSF